MDKFNGILTRLVDFQMAESPEAEHTDGRTLEGYAAVFEQDTEINSFEGRFLERVARGAFAKTLSERKPLMQYDHGRDFRVGTVPIGAYEDIREDGHGLKVVGRMFDNDIVEPVRQAIEGGAITGMSFKFQVTRDEWRDGLGNEVRGEELFDLLYDAGERGPLRRTIKEVKLFEAGPVSSPAYAQTTVGVRGVEDLSEDERNSLVEQYRESMGDTSVNTPNSPEAAGKKPPRRSEKQPSDDGIRCSPEDENIFRWLEAERVYRWLEAETEHTRTGDAGDSSTSPEQTRDHDADRQVTSRAGASTKNKTRKNVSAMTLEELRARLAEIDVRTEEINEEYRNAEIPEAQERELGSIAEERGKVEARIDKIVKRMEQLADGSGRSSESGFGSPAFHKKSDNLYDLDAIRADSNGTAEDFASRLRDNALRAADQADYGIDTLPGDQDPVENVHRLLKRADDNKGTLARRVLATGSPEYERAFSKALAAGTPQVLNSEEYRALSLGTDASGGFAVPFELDPTVIHTSAGVIDPLRQISTVKTITGKKWQGVTSAGTTVSRAPEAAEVGDDSFTMAQPEIETHRVHGFVPWSYELDGSWGQLRSEVTFALSDAKGREEASAFTLGDGVAPNPFGVVSTLAAGSEVTGTGGVDTFIVSDVYDLEDALPTRYRHGNTKFLAHHSIYNKLRQFASSDGHDLWERIGAGQPSQILGYSAMESSTMDSTIVGGNKIMLYGDFRYFCIVDRVGMGVELIPQVFGANQRPTGQRGIYAYWNNGSDILVDDAFRVLVVPAV